MNSTIKKNMGITDLRIQLIWPFCCAFAAFASSIPEEKIPSAMFLTTCPSADATLTEVNSSNCCYSLQLSLEPGNGYTAVETVLITPGVLYSAIQYDLSGGWYYYFSAPQGLIWERASGSLPIGNTPLFDFCISGDVTTEPAKIVVSWMVNNIRICTDTLELPCSRCLEIEPESLTCLADSNSQYIFQFTNHSEFNVNSLRITEPPGQDLIVEDAFSLLPLLAPGDSQTLSLTLRSGAEDQASICFDATSSRHLEGVGNVECCTITHCFEGPECDRCCTDFGQFEADVAAGFNVAADCEADSLIVSGDKLSNCDLVQWRLLNLSAGTSIGGVSQGNIPIVFSFLGGTNYELCMTVTRQDANGVDCYPEPTLTYCDTLLFDCPCVDSSHINWDYECPAEIELVCGCDSMTYVNDCAALNWSGVESWTPGECHDPPAGTISLNVTPIGAQAQLDWTTGQGNVSYRFFIVQRRLSGGLWVTLAVVSGLTFSFLDPTPGAGLNLYRIVGVTYPGKPVFSNVDDFLITDLTETAIAGHWHVWPNPAGNQLRITAEYEGEAALSLINADGSMRKSESRHFVRDQALQIDISTLHPGVYLLRLRRNDGTIVVQRFVKM